MLKTIDKTVYLHIKLYVLEYIGFLIAFILILMALDYIEGEYLLLLLAIVTVCFEYRRNILKEIRTNKNPYFFMFVIVSLLCSNYLFIQYYNIAILYNDLWVLSAPYLVLLFNEYKYYKRSKE